MRLPQLGAIRHDEVANRVPPLDLTPAVTLENLRRRGVFVDLVRPLPADLFADEISEGNLNGFGAQGPQVRLGQILFGLLLPMHPHLRQRTTNLIPAPATRANKENASRQANAHEQANSGAPMPRTNA